MAKAKSEGQRIRAMLVEHLKEKDRAVLGELRAKIRRAKVKRRQLLERAREHCAISRSILKAQQRAKREQLREQQVAARSADRGQCSAAKAGARRRGAELELEARRERDEARTLQRQVRAADQRVSVRRSSARERHQESDEAVSRNLAPELEPVWEAMKRKITPRPRQSRTEAFLEWAEENPDEVIAIQAAGAESELKQLIKQQRELGRAVRKAGRYKQSPEELKRLLADVPF